MAKNHLKVEISFLVLSLFSAASFGAASLVKTFNSLADMRAANPFDIYTNAFLADGTGMFTFHPGATNADDGRRIIVPNGGGGAWFYNTNSMPVWTGIAKDLGSFQVFAGTVADTNYVSWFTGTLANSVQDQYGNLFSVTSAGTNTGAQYAVRTDLTPGYTGPGETFALRSVNETDGQGVSYVNANFGVSGVSHGSGPGGGNVNIGLHGQSRWAKNESIGVMGLGVNNNGLQTNLAQNSIGVYGRGDNGSDTTGHTIGVYAQLGSVDSPLNFNTALGADNGATGQRILYLRDNSSPAMIVDPNGENGVYHGNPFNSYVDFDLGYDPGSTRYSARIRATQNANVVNGSQLWLQTHQVSATSNAWNYVWFADQNGNVQYGMTNNSAPIYPHEFYRPVASGDSVVAGFYNGNNVNGSAGIQLGYDPSSTPTSSRILSRSNAGSGPGSSLLLQTHPVDNTSNLWNNALFADNRGYVGILMTNPATALDVTGIERTSGHRSVTNDFVVTNSTVLTDIPNTVVTLNDGQRYSFTAKLFVTADAAGGSKYAVAFNGTVTSIVYEVVAISEASNLIPIISRKSSVGASIGNTGETALWVNIDGTIAVNNGGQLSIQFAENVSTNTSTIKAGSFLRVNADN